MAAHDTTIGLGSDKATLNATLHSLADGVLVCDMEGQFILFNQEAERIVGYGAREGSPEEMAASYGVFGEDGTTPVAGEDLPLFRALRGETTRGLVMRIRNDMTGPAGVLIDTNSAPVIDATGRQIGAVVVMRDITEARALQVEHAQSQKLESIGRLASGIAHEINTPTQYVADNLNFLKESFADLISALKPGRDRLSDEVQFLIDELPDAIEQSIEGASRIATIVRAMKEFSHPGSSTPELVDLNRAIESTVTVASNQWKYIAELDLQLSVDLPPVPCVVSEFNQVLLNMIVNACHAIEDAQAEGGEKGRITIRTSCQPNKVVHVEVSDTGVGMAEEVRQKLFEPFFTTKEVGRGTGQGLAIARSVIVEKHHGRIEVDSTPGEGTTFHIYLPTERVKDAMEGNGL